MMARCCDLCLKAMSVARGDLAEANLYANVTKSGPSVFLMGSVTATVREEDGSTRRADLCRDCLIGMLYRVQVETPPKAAEARKEG